jgi:DDE superfamily endonuclease
MWCIPALDADYVRKMEDVLAVYEKPYKASEPVVCLDEKPICLHADVRAALPARPGQIAKRDSEYKRCGTANVFCAVEPKAGRHFTFPTPNRSGPEWARVLERIIGSYPFARTIHLVMDNLNIHCRKTLADHFGEEWGDYLWNRLTAHYTPKHGSWLNQAEIEISLFARQCLGTRRIPTLAQLQSEARSWNRKVNREKLTIDWQFTRKAARQKFGYDKNSFTRSRN